MAKQYSIADEGDGLPSVRKGDDLDIEVETQAPEDERENLSDEEMFDDITPARKKTPAVEDEIDDEADEDEVGGDDGEEEEEPAPAPRDKFEKRLARERRLIEEARADLRDAVTELRHFKDVATKKASEEELTKIKSDAEDRLKKLRADFEQAAEDGDTKAQLRISEEIADIKADVRVKEAEAKRAAEVSATAPETGRAQRAAQQWIRKHKRYHTDPVFKAAAIALDKKLLAEGSDNSDVEHYEAIDKELSRRFPEEYKKAPRRREAPTNGAASGTESPTRKSGAFIRRGKKVIISSRQAENMRRFGLDPDSADDVKAYVRENS